MECLDEAIGLAGGNAGIAREDGIARSKRHAHVVGLLHEQPEQKGLFIVEIVYPDKVPEVRIVEIIDMLECFCIYFSCHPDTVPPGMVPTIVAVLLDRAH